MAALLSRRGPCGRGSPAASSTAAARGSATTWSTSPSASLRRCETELSCDAGPCVSVLHVTNGDAVVPELAAAAGVAEEDVLPWRDVLHDGPVPGGLDPDELARVRAAHLASRGWAAEDEALASLRERDRRLATFPEPREIVLWFEDDLYDALQLRADRRPPPGAARTGVLHAAPASAARRPRAGAVGAPADRAGRPAVRRPAGARPAGVAVGGGIRAARRGVARPADGPEPARREILEALAEARSRPPPCSPPCPSVSTRRGWPTRRCGPWPTTSSRSCRARAAPTR